MTKIQCEVISFIIFWREVETSTMYLNEDKVSTEKPSGQCTILHILEACILVRIAKLHSMVLCSMLPGLVSTEGMCGKGDLMEKSHFRATCLREKHRGCFPFQLRPPCQKASIFWKLHKFYIFSSETMVWLVNISPQKTNHVKQIKGAMSRRKWLIHPLSSYKENPEQQKFTP